MQPSRSACARTSDRISPLAAIEFKSSTARSEETFSFYRLPREHHKHMKSTNMLERLNGEIKRRTHVVRIFPNEASCLRLIRALAVEIHENWIEATRYLNMDVLEEHKRELLRVSAA